MFHKRDQKTAITSLIILGFVYSYPALSQDQTRTLGKALVGQAQDKMTTESGSSADLMNAPAPVTPSAPVEMPVAPPAPALGDVGGSGGPIDQKPDAGTSDKLEGAEKDSGDQSVSPLPLGLLDGIQLPDQPTTDSVLSKVESDVEIELKRLEESEGKLPSILFSESEANKLDDAIHVYETGNFEKKVDPAVAPSPDSPVDPLLNVEIVDRDLVLGGISYGDGKNWVIWLNKQRLTPERLPVEVKYINVQKGHVDVKWLDKLTGKLIPVRLRPNQRFNLDTSMFLPGTAG